MLSIVSIREDLDAIRPIERPPLQGPLEFYCDDEALAILVAAWPRIRDYAIKVPTGYGGYFWKISGWA